LAVCLFDQNALVEAKRLRVEHKRKIISGLQKVINEGVKFMDNIQYFYTTETTYAGTFAGLGMMYLFDHEKPTIVLSERNGKFKISGRGTSYLVDKGLDLANALGTAAEGVDGYGGGHSIAAGATIPLEMDQEFLKELDIIVGTQLKGHTT
jgi:RecJ-like exonuclease